MQAPKQQRRSSAAPAAAAAAGSGGTSPVAAPSTSGQAAGQPLAAVSDADLVVPAPEVLAAASVQQLMSYIDNSLSGALQVCCRLLRWPRSAPSPAGCPCWDLSKNDRKEWAACSLQSSGLCACARLTPVLPPCCCLLSQQALQARVMSGNAICPSMDYVMSMKNFKLDPLYASVSAVSRRLAELLLHTQHTLCSHDCIPALKPISVSTVVLVFSCCTGQPSAANSPTLVLSQHQLARLTRPCSLSAAAVCCPSCSVLP